MILLIICYQKFRSHNFKLIPVFNLSQKIKRYTQRSLFTLNKNINQPLLNNDEIIDLLLRIKTNKNKFQRKHDSAFRRIGDFRSIYRGQGMDYEESRHYQAGDDPRHMNWQLTARTGQHYMKIFREERQAGVFIVIDRRDTMRFGTRKRLKVTQAARLATAAALLAQENNVSVGGVILDNEAQWFKENQNKHSIFSFIHQATRPVIPVFDKHQQPQNIRSVLLMLNEVLTSGTTVYFISDFYDLTEDCQPILLELSSSHKIFAIQITDPAEIKLPKAGILSLKSAESEKKCAINSSSKMEQDNYKSWSEDYFSSKKSLFENIAISFKQVLTTDEAIEQEIV